MAAAHIGLIGLGVMGRNLALNLVDNGYTVAVYNRTRETTDAFLAEAGDQRDGLIGCATLDELVSHLRPPRPVLLMVKAGDAVDQQIEALAPLLEAGDVLMDGGNANFRDTRRRAAVLQEQGLEFLGVGVSGGELGARHGPSIMVGGSSDGFAAVSAMLQAVAAKAGEDRCCAYLGTDGAGHFVKTLHNGIEYADMQMIAEAYHILRHGHAMAPAECGAAFRRWNEGPLSSYLIEITADILETIDPDTGDALVEKILDRAGEKGTGRWATAEALDLGVPAPTIAEAVAARAVSSLKEERLAAAKLYAEIGVTEPTPIDEPRAVEAVVRSMAGALLAGKIAAYAQGFAVLSAASRQWGWDLPLDRIAQIWRAGCIIRSRFLDDIAAAYATPPAPANLLVAPHFVAIMGRHQIDLRQIVSFAIGIGLPVPAMASALAYFDSYRRDRLWADMIQAQRDYFGAHTFERTDRPGSFHFEWASGDEA